MRSLLTNKAILCALTGVLAGAVLQAQTAPAVPACDASNCTLQDFEAMRETTETLYGDVLLILSAHERPALRSNQQNWRRVARAHCNQVAPAGGALEASSASAHHACMIEQEQERRLQIRQWLMHGYSVDGG
ncbi:lysozyme inhibitor LprI family protein [Lampropedia aestuarii]|nr:lysozyme inhibitor LprI family protein [Lampropedia aestuarii]